MLDPKRLGLACGIAWGLSVFMLAIGAGYFGVWEQNIALVSSLYFGTISAGINGAIAGLIIGLIDGFVLGYVVAWLYNWLENKV